MALFMALFMAWFRPSSWPGLWPTPFWVLGFLINCAHGNGQLLLYGSAGVQCDWPGGWQLGGGLRTLGQCFRRSGCMCVTAVGWLAGAPVDGVLGWVAVAAVVCFLRVGGGWDYRDGPGAGVCGWATALAHAFGWVGSTLVEVELRSWGWGLVSLPSLRWSGPHWPPFPGFPGLAALVCGLHCAAGTPQALRRRLFLVPHCALGLSRLGVGGHRGAGDGLAGSACGSRAWGAIGAGCSRVAGATAPGPPPRPHGWVGFGVSGLPDFCEGGLACAELPMGVEFGALWSHFFLHILKEKKALGVGVRVRASCSINYAKLQPPPQWDTLGNKVNISSRQLWYVLTQTHA